MMYVLYTSHQESSETEFPHQSGCLPLPKLPQSVRLMSLPAAAVVVDPLQQLRYVTA